VLPMAQAAPVGEVFVTVTGSVDVIGEEHIAVMRDGAILANAGHFDVEIDVRALAGFATAVHRDVRPHVDAYDLGDGRTVLLLAEGRVVNLVAAEGHPPEVMDLAFGIEALALAWLALATRPSNPAGKLAPGKLAPGKLAPGVHEVPEDIDAEAARLVLGTMGTSIDTLTPAQLSYRESWRIGSLQLPCAATVRWPAGPASRPQRAPRASRCRPGPRRRWTAAGSAPATRAARSGTRSIPTGWRAPA